MISVEPRVHVVPLKTPTLPPATHTNCYLIGQERFMVVDPGAHDADERALLYQVIDERIARGEALTHVVITHSHRDHIGGVSELKERYSIPLAAHALSAERAGLSAEVLLDDGDLLDPHHGETGDFPSEQAWRVWHTPGHAPGHICLIHEPSRVAIVGDMVAGVGTIIIDPEDGDMGSYLRQLERLRAADLTRLLPSHGEAIDTPRTLLTHYLDHRRKREARIASALPSARSIAQGGGEVIWMRLKDIVEIAYADAPLKARRGRFGGLAGRATLAHLIELQRRGCVLCSEPHPRLESRWIALEEIQSHESARLFELGQAAQRLQVMMTSLRAQCPWDRRQTLESLRRYLIEETYEVLDAMNSTAHCEELGDLFFQILFQSKIREEEEIFDLIDVMHSLTSKLARRHPHVFGELDALTSEEARSIWNQIKAQERTQKPSRDQGVLSSIPSAAPALMRAQMIGEKVAAVGFDWPSVRGALEKVDEERIEVEEAITLGDREALTSELGDLLFSVVNVCRHLEISPETALERTNQVFSQRFQIVERLANQRKADLKDLTIDELEVMWSEAKSFLKHS